jgi:hypothetical protein
MANPIVQEVYTQMWELGSALLGVIFADYIMKVSIFSGVSQSITLIEKIWADYTSTEAILEDLR